MIVLFVGWLADSDCHAPTEEIHRLSFRTLPVSMGYTEGARLEKGMNTSYKNNGIYIKNDQCCIRRISPSSSTVQSAGARTVGLAEGGGGISQDRVKELMRSQVAAPSRYSNEGERINNIVLEISQERFAQYAPKVVPEVCLPTPAPPAPPLRECDRVIFSVN